MIGRELDNSSAAARRYEDSLNICSFMKGVEEKLNENGRTV